VIVVVAIKQPSGLNDVAHSLTAKESDGACVSPATTGVVVAVDDAVADGDDAKEDMLGDAELDVEDVVV